MVPEYLVAIVVTTVVSWGSFVWRRAENALEASKAVAAKTDRLELKLAEHYLTKGDFDAQMARLFVVLDRLENKLDTSVVARVSDFQALYQRRKGEEQ